LDKSKLLVTADGFFWGVFGLRVLAGVGKNRRSVFRDNAVGSLQREETLAAFAVFGKTRGAKSPGGGVETRAGVLR
jgi:hypothetical protein